MANQTGIVGNPYAGGNVVFNQTPFTQFYLNSLARQQAQKDAFAKSMQEQAKSLTPAGMRTQDVQALMQAKNDWQNHWMQNKDNIMHPDRDNGKAWSENNDLFNKAAATTTQSKEAAKTDQALLKLSLDPKRAGLIANDARDLIHRHQLPVNDPNHKTLLESDLDTPLFNKRQPTLQEQIALENVINSKHKGEEIGRTPGQTDPTTFMRNDVVTYRPTEGEKQQIHDMAVGLYNANDPNMSFIDKLVENHSHGVNNPQYDELNNLYNKYYGKNIEHPEEAATAYLIGKNANYGQKVVPTKDIAAEKAAVNAEWERRNAITNKQQNERQIKSFSHQDQTNYNPISHVDAIYNSGQDDNTTYNIGGKQVKGKIVSLPEEVESKLFDKRKGVVIRPDRQIMDNNKQNLHLIFFDGKTPSGNDIIDKERTRTIPINSSLVPTLEKTFGNPKRNLYTAPPVITKPTNITTAGKVR